MYNMTRHQVGKRVDDGGVASIVDGTIFRLDTVIDPVGAYPGGPKKKPIVPVDSTDASYRPATLRETERPNQVPLNAPSPVAR